MTGVSAAVDRLTSALGRLPGIGAKSAERLAHHLLKCSPEEALELAEAIRAAKQQIRHCQICFHLTEADQPVCAICRDARRDQGVVCVVEQPRDLLALEAAGIFHGVYHVLGGRISPLSGVGPDDLTIDALLHRIRTAEIREIVMATNPTLEGDGTSLYISNLLADSLREHTSAAPSGHGPDYVGVYVVGIRNPDEAPQIAQRIDALFKNSNAETRTETEKAFQLSFIAMSETILLAIKAVSFIIILIIMAVMANTMTMTARERLSEYATLKALGFAPGFVVRLLFGESLMIALIGGALGIALTFPVAHAFVKATGTLFPIFKVSVLTLELQWAASVVVGAIAAAWPAWRMSRIDIVQGLRHVA